LLSVERCDLAVEKLSRRDCTAHEKRPPEGSDGRLNICLPKQLTLKGATKDLLRFFFFRLFLLLLFPSAGVFRDFRLRNAKDALRLVPAVFVRKLCDTFSSLHYVSGSDQPTAAFQALIKTHRTYLQICNPALKRGILRVWLNFAVSSQNHRLREAKDSKPDGIRLQLAEF
jgi:hypothetical protein